MTKNKFLNTRVSNKMKLDLKTISKNENRPVGAIVRNVLNKYDEKFS